MNIKQLLSNIETITILHSDVQVEQTVAAFLKPSVAERATVSNEPQEKNNLRIGVLNTEETKTNSISTEEAEWRFIRIWENGNIELYTSHS